MSKPAVFGKEDYARYMSSQTKAAHRVFKFRRITAAEKKENAKRSRLRLIRQIARRKALKAELNKGGS